MYFWERKNEIRDSDEKSAGCGILVKKERECEIRTPLPDPDLDQYKTGDSQ